MKTDNILEVDNLSKLYSRSDSSTRKRISSAFSRALFWRAPKPVHKLLSGEFWSLNKINFSLERGEAIGVIGFNGAGKTTLLRILSGQILPESGEIRVLGSTAAMIDLTAGFNPNASGRQNIYLRGASLGHSEAFMREKEESIIEFSELGDAIDAPFSTYSSGMQMRIAFSVMIVSEPDILFIDEVLSVGDFRFQQKCLAKIREIRERVAFVLVSHSMANVKLFCTKAIVLHKGDIVFEGCPEESIAFYENMKNPETQSIQAKQAATLTPQFQNPDAVTDVVHYWSDKDGNRIDEIRSGETLYLSVSFTALHAPRNLVIGVPVWNEDGEYVTGFSTEVTKSSFKVLPNQKSSFVLEVPSLAFNAGNYISNLGITDGPEFLFRTANPPLRVIQSRSRYWGMVSLPHTWSQVEAKVD